MSRLFGGNRAFIDRTIPHITALMSDTLDDLLRSSELVVVGKTIPGLDDGLDRVAARDQTLLDLVRQWDRSLEQVAGRRIVRIC